MSVSTNYAWCRRVGDKWVPQAGSPSMKEIMDYTIMPEYLRANGWTAPEKENK